MARLLLFLIRVYQLTLSPFIGNSCRHIPTCSHYTAGAIRRFGAWRGFWLGLSRVCRCHPWGSQGLDPVPEKLEMRYGILSAWRYGRWRG
ncbi:MAG: membrane protein insertion efficiency factor YidD [Pseudomonadota bacterium]